jgi:hypothetical protein
VLRIASAASLMTAVSAVSVPTNATHVCDVVYAVQELCARQRHRLCKMRISRLVAGVLQRRPQASLLLPSGSAHHAALSGGAQAELRAAASGA